MFALPFLAVLAVSVVMYRVAETRTHDGPVWGVVTFLLCIVGAVAVKTPFVDALVGLALACLAYLAYLAYTRRKGNGS